MKTCYLCNKKITTKPHVLKYGFLHLKRKYSHYGCFIISIEKEIVERYFLILKKMQKDGNKSM